MITFLDKEIPVFFQDLNIDEETFSEVVGTILSEFDFDIEHMQTEIEEDIEALVDRTASDLYEYNEHFENMSVCDVEDLLRFVASLDTDNVEDIAENF